MFPAQWRGSVVLMVLGLWPLPLLVFWAVRIRFGTTFRDTSKRTDARSPHTLLAEAASAKWDGTR